MLYLALKHLHVTCVVLSITGFLLRGIWVLGDHRLARARLVRVLPHVIDSVLLASAIGLAVLIQQYPFSAGWVTAKVLGLLLYIALGMVALRRGRSRVQRVAALLGALAVFGWIVSVAVSKNPAGFLAVAGVFA
ncbi:regulator SirB [Pseudothauera nasutitermitis]|uniref:Regulator SirB n=1 Tax=Pseudothauera nasutitermitis TaxID=2565930 RepID=A0A4S4B029_9RHOO|nr:SirB2 family protein [Pseudothauera nasutitermitis]THF65828.1 regulator SirB [Pseudothauera nasutitermitis]